MKNVVLFLVFSLLVYALAGLLEHAGAFRLHNETVEQKQRRKAFTGRIGMVEQFTVKMDYSLKQLGISHPVLLGMMVACYGIGYMLGLIVLMDNLLAAIAGMAAMFLPFVYVQLQNDWQSQNLVEKLESSMMCITNAYIASNDLVKAVQDSISIIEYKAPFEGFLADVNFIDSSVIRALRRMEVKVTNPYFSQWINVLIQAQNDHNVAAMATVSVKQMNAVRRKQIEADTVMFSQWREFFTGIIMVFAIPIVLRVLMYEWYVTLVSTPIGRLLMIGVIVSMVFAVDSAMKINRPVTIRS